MHSDVYTFFALFHFVELWNEDKKVRKEFAGRSFERARKSRDFFLLSAWPIRHWNKLSKEWGWVQGLSLAWGRSSAKADWPSTPHQFQSSHLLLIGMTDPSHQEWQSWRFQEIKSTSSLPKTWSRSKESFAIDLKTFLCSSSNSAAIKV